MAWTIELSDPAKKNLKQLDPQTTRRILVFLFERLSALENPRSIGEALQGADLGAYWKYRVGDYRLICEIEDKKITVNLLKVGHRREVYK
jgi:mRNA interferase RelE/StbE